VTRLCESCGKRRQLRFFGPDARRTDGLSTRCVSCAKRRRQTTSRDQRLWESYGITTLDYDAILAAQGGVCAICKGSRPYLLDVDHDHALEKAGVPLRQTVRGALCKRCNRRLLRCVGDDIAILAAAIEYLQDPPAMRILES